MPKRNDIFMDDSPPNRNGAKAIFLSVGGIVLLVLLSWFVYAQFRIDVGTGEIAVLIHKTGKDIPNNAELAPTLEHKGIQREVLTEGRYFKNPYEWDWEVIDQTVIPQGKLGVKISLTGEDLGYGEFLAKKDKDGNIYTKGIVPEVLKPARYPINPYLYRVEMHDPVTIPAGYRGVVTNLAGPFPDDPNVLLVDPDDRGVQAETKSPGTYYINPYVTRISLIDCRSQRFNIASNKDMGFPSKDGFWVSLDGIIEFRVNPEMAAEVFVTYNEDTNGDKIDEEIIRKVIMPNARSFCRVEGSKKLGREFIGTRVQFQNDFQNAMNEKCKPLGIEIVQALITDVQPPEQVRELVEERSLAERTRDQYLSEIKEQAVKERRAIAEEMVNQKQALIEVEQEIVKITKKAEEEQKVAVTEANKKLGVADFKLQASQDEAAAIVSRGKAEADVIRFENEADAAGWKKAVESFDGNGGQYAQFVLFQKMAPSYQRMMVNTADSPITRIFEGFVNPASNQPGSSVGDSSGPITSGPVPPLKDSAVTE